MYRSLFFYLALTTFIFHHTVCKAQEFSLQIGTDIPYQHYLSANLQVGSVQFSYGTGVLVPPYSDAILALIQGLGVDEIYIDLLDASFQFGWMNQVGVSYVFGKQKRWHAGLECRFDLLTAADTPADLFEAATGEDFQTPNGGTFSSGNMSGAPNKPSDIQVQLGLSLFAAGVRVGYTHPLSKTAHHFLRAEFSFAKHFGLESRLIVNGNMSEDINSLLDDYFWDDVFKDYGMLGGLGIAYLYKF